jgi:hypothetical protein
MTSQPRAKIGGEYGKNGLHYDGGQFIAQTDLPKMTHNNRIEASHKEEIAPYIWQIAPQGKRSIYSLIGGTAAQWNIKNVSFKPFEPFLKTQSQERAAYLRSLIEKWNAGERWIDR